MDWYGVHRYGVALCTHANIQLYLDNTRIIYEHKHFYLVKKREGERESGKGSE